VERIIAAAGAGIAVPPEESAAFIAALSGLLADPDGLVSMGEQARAYVEKAASPSGVALAYQAVFDRVRRP
jgi:glycosyltransferase involved in cell wall biosynthesis